MDIWIKINYTFREIISDSHASTLREAGAILSIGTFKDN
jgi:hypothetical protein